MAACKNQSINEHRAIPLHHYDYRVRFFSEILWQGGIASCYCRLQL